MSLVSEIQTIIKTLYPDATFILSSKFQANVATYLADGLALPIVILDNELSKTASIQKNNNILKDSKILISFLDLDSTDNTDVQSEAIREAMEAMADRVANNIYQLQSVHPIGNQKYKITPLFHVFSSNMTGVALEMQVNYNEIITMCKIP